MPNYVEQSKRVQSRLLNLFHKTPSLPGEHPMKVAASFLVLSTFFVLCCDSAEARYFRPVYNYDAVEVARQQRANMAERTHQQKELMEATRLNNERERISAASTVKTYGTVKKSNRRSRNGNSRLADRQRVNGYRPQAKQL